LNRAEVAVLCLVYLCMGVALGAFTASPYPLTSHQWDEVFSFYLVGMIVFVWLSIHRINKEWKFRTMPPPTE
jgi:1,4-dihydroxy-2-naphthoate octaprenyltransferase